MIRPRADRTPQGRSAPAGVRPGRHRAGRRRAGYPDFLDWLDAGHAAGMDYIERHGRAARIPERCSRASARS